MDEKYTITQVSAMLDIKEPTLRKYENDYNIKIPRNELGHRCYTQKEIDLLQQIKTLKSKGANIHLINNLLERSEIAIEQSQQALELVTLDKLTGVELKQILLNSISNLVIEREEILKNEYERKLEEVKIEIKEEIRKEFEKRNQKPKTFFNKIFDVFGKSLKN